MRIDSIFAKAAVSVGLGLTLTLGGAGAAQAIDGYIPDDTLRSDQPYPNEAACNSMRTMYSAWWKDIRPCEQFSDGWRFSFRYHM